MQLSVVLEVQETLLTELVGLVIKAIYLKL